MQLSEIPAMPAYYTDLYTAKGDVLFAARDIAGARAAYGLSLEYAQQAKRVGFFNHDPTREPEEKLRKINAPDPTFTRATELTASPSSTLSFATGKRFALLVATDE